MEKWEYQVVLVNKWGKAVRQASKPTSETWQFDDAQASDRGIPVSCGPGA
jgi:hypothetical protein